MISLMVQRMLIVEIGFPIYTKIMEIISNSIGLSIRYPEKCLVLKKKFFDKTLLKSLADIKIKDFDVVFLCRSDNFFAPHLDPYFDEIVRLIESRFHDIRIEKSVNEVRDYRKYDSMYEKLHRSLKNS